MTSIQIFIPQVLVSKCLVPVDPMLLMWDPVDPMLMMWVFFKKKLTVFSLINIDHMYVQIWMYASVFTVFKKKTYWYFICNVAFPSCL